MVILFPVKRKVCDRKDFVLFTAFSVPRAGSGNRIGPK